MKRAITWFLFNGAFGFCGYLGLFQGTVGALNVFLLLVWFTSVATIITVGNDELHAKLYAKGRSVPTWVAVLFDCAIFGSLAWHGYMATACLALLGAVCEWAIYSEAPKGKVK